MKQSNMPQRRTLAFVAMSIGILVALVLVALVAFYWLLAR